MSSDDERTGSSCLTFRVSALEADLAYFSARLELLGKPVTRHQLAQLKAYQTMHRSLEELLIQLRQSEKRSDL